MKCLLLFYIILLSIFLSNTHSAHAGEKKLAIKLGATLPLSGNLASYGEKIRQGIDFAIKDSESDVEFIADDTPMSGAGVLTIVNKLIKHNKISALAGNFSNVAMLTMAPVLARNNTIAMHTSALDDEILKSSKGNIFSTNTRISDEAKMMARQVYNDTTSHRAAVITIETNFGITYAKYFIEEFSRLGGTIVATEQYQLGETDYKAQLSRIKKTNPEAIYAATFGHFLGYTLKQSREMGITSKFYSVYETEDSSVIESGGLAATEGLRYFVSYAPAKTKESIEFFKRYHDNFGKFPETFTLDAYDATKILISALTVCNNETECTKQKLRTIKDYQGISGTLAIQEDGSSKKTFYLKEIREGKFEFIN